jgi:hypothetical protein
MGTNHKHVARRVKLTEMLSCETLFIPSWLSARQSTKLSAEVNPQGRSVKKVNLLLNDSHLESQAMRRQRHHGNHDLE